jgi:hypothetical protein
MMEFRRNTPGRLSADFQRWIEGHPDGYFVNLIAKDRGRLHRADCWHMSFNVPVDLVTRPKWADEDRRALERRAREEGVTLVNCTDCRV